MSGPPEGLHRDAGPPAGWHPDPHGRFPQRYWDGARWTAHVSDGTTVAQDVVAASRGLSDSGAGRCAVRDQHGGHGRAADEPAPDASMSVLTVAASPTYAARWACW